MIEFGNPWMLLGLLAALVPVWLHLMGRRHAQILHFSALGFILASNPQRARAMRLREWLLVALRCAAVVALVVALARPMLPVLGGGDGPDAGSGPQAVVLVLDDSLSMSAGSAGGALLDRAKRRAANLVQRLPAGSRAALVTSGYPARPVVRQLTADRGAVLDALRQVVARPRRDDAARALSLAEAMLDGADVPARRIVLFSDLQASGWQQVQPPVRTHQGEPIGLSIDVFRADSPENTALVEAVVSGASDAAGQVRVDVTVRHAGDKVFRDYLTLRAGEREIKSLVQLQPGETARRTFSVPAGSPWAEVLLPPDALEADNRRLVRLDTSTALRVALVNGAPRPVPREDEVFFAARALEAAAGPDGGLVVDVLPADKLTAASLAEPDVVVLANAAQPAEDGLRALKAAVAGGKGLLVTVGDNLPDPPQDYLDGLLPARLAGQRNLASRDGAPRGATSLRWTPPTETLAAADAVVQLQRLLGEGVGDAIGQCQVHRYALVEPGDNLAALVVARYGDGAPALLLGRHQAGRVALLTTTLDRDWTNLPLQPGFVPSLQLLVSALAGPRTHERRAPITPGEVAQLSRDPRAEQLEVRYEGGSAGPPPERQVLTAPTQPAAGWSLRGLDLPGRYVATELRGGVALTSRHVLVVPTAAESDMRTATTGPLAKTASGKGGQPARLPTAPGWSAMLLVLLVLLGLEAWTLARGTRSRGAAHRPAR